MKKLLVFVSIFVLFSFLIACTKAESPPGKIAGGQGNCVCIQVYDPVCGQDGQTYSNSCYAKCAGVETTSGECLKYSNSP